VVAVWFKRRPRCQHLFIGLHMGHRGPDGKLDWRCARCGEVFRFEYGLQAGEVGTIAGPW